MQKIVRESRSSISISSSEREYARLAEFGGVLPRRNRLSFGDRERRRLSLLRDRSLKKQQQIIRNENKSYLVQVRLSFR